jgi:hypothetical protein
VALKLLGCAIMRRSQRRWLFGAEAADTEFSEQRWSGLRCCAEASTLTRNFHDGSSSCIAFAGCENCGNVGEPFLYKVRLNGKTWLLRIVL